MGTNRIHPGMLPRGAACSRSSTLKLLSRAVLCRILGYALECPPAVRLLVALQRCAKFRQEAESLSSILCSTVQFPELLQRTALSCQFKHLFRGPPRRLTTLPCDTDSTGVGTCGPLSGVHRASMPGPMPRPGRVTVGHPGDLARSNGRLRRSPTLMRTTG